jgi:tetratricopeptide (TPR) repeat protein
MLSGSSKDRKNAQELLKKIEEGIHTKIHRSGKTAEDAMKIGDYEKAVKEYEKAAGLALEIFDKNLAKSLKDRALIAKKVPNITKERNKAINDARSSLRNEDFHSAYLNYRKAAELSEQLMDFEKAEEYSLKSKALSDFHSVDKKFKKK